MEEDRTLELVQQIGVEIRGFSDAMSSKIDALNNRLTALETQKAAQSRQFDEIMRLIANHADRLELLEGRDP